MARKRCSTYVRPLGKADVQVIEQKGATAGDEQDQIRERINAQLEQANAQIKALEAQLAQFGGGAYTGSCCMTELTKQHHRRSAKDPSRV